MKPIICPQCGDKITDYKPVDNFAVCGNCGANAPLPIEKTAASGEATAPQTKSRLPTILITSFFAALFLIALFAGGAYWFINKFPEISGVRPTPRPKIVSPISATEIVQVEYTESTNRIEYPAQYFSNLTPINSFFRSLTVTFINDGRAKKAMYQREITNRVGTPERVERHTGAIAPEKFVELARVLIENDFLGEEDSKTSTYSPTNHTLTVVYVSKSKSIQISDSGSHSPEAEAMMQAFRRLENSVEWQKQ